MESVEKCDQERDGHEEEEEQLGEIVDFLVEKTLLHACHARVHLGSSMLSSVDDETKGLVLGCKDGVSPHRVFQGHWFLNGGFGLQILSLIESLIVIDQLGWLFAIQGTVSQVVNVFHGTKQMLAITRQSKTCLSRVERPSNLPVSLSIELVRPYKDTA